jgi:cation:H+ antiporter
MLLDTVLVVAGLGLLILGGEALVRGASTLAVKVGLSPLVIGLVVVSAATSAPEFAVTVGAVINDQPDLAVGNVVGSNIVNILFILGVSAIFAPLVIKRQLVRIDIPVMVVLSVGVLLLCLDGKVDFVDGLLLLLALVAHTIGSIILGRRETAKNNQESESLPLNGKPVPIWLALLLLIVGIGLLVLGAQVLVTGAVSIATSLGVSSLVIGLTVVAAGTSLPELATSIVAIRKGETDMAVGNIVGSNIFNIGMVLGLPAMLFGSGIPVAQSVIAIDIPIMIAAAIALLPVAFTGFAVARWEGLLFVAMYAAFTIYLILNSTQHDAANGFNSIMLWFVLPLLAATLLAVTAYEVGLYRGKKLAKMAKPDSYEI